MSPKSKMLYSRREAMMLGMGLGLIARSDRLAGTFGNKKLSPAVSGHPVGIHQNRFFFKDNTGKAMMLTGSHTWMRKQESDRWVSDGWDLHKFNKYLDFLQHWNHNYIRLWMWEQEGVVDIWKKDVNGKFDLAALNEDYFDLKRSFVEAATSRNMVVGVMLFQGWSGCCKASAADWSFHPMNRDKNINGVNGDPGGLGFGGNVHALTDPQILSFQKNYVRRMIDLLNDFDNVFWEIGNETIETSIPWKAHMVQFIREIERNKEKQHLILDGTGNGVGNDSVWITQPDVFSPCVVTRWSSPNDPFIANPPIPKSDPGKPILLDNDHLGNHFLRFTARQQRNWTWKSFLRGNHPLHMDCYDVPWDNENPTLDHPIPGVATHPHYDPQRKSLGDVRSFSTRINLAQLVPTDDPAICSTAYCLFNPGKEYLAYQPDLHRDIGINLPQGVYAVETFDAITGALEFSQLKWEGGNKIFTPSPAIREDWALYVRTQ